MRILILSNEYPPHSLGGYEIACARTADWLRARGHQISILTGKGPTAPDDQRQGVQRVFQRIDYLHGGYRQKWQTERHNYLLTLDRLLTVKPDLVYLWNQRSISLGPALAVSRLGLPKVYEFGDFWPDAYLKPGLGPWIKREIKRHLPGTIGGKLDLNPVIAVSRWMVPEIRQKYASRQIHFIPNGIALPEQVHTPAWNQPLRALFVGRIDPEKGLHLAIEALARLQAAGQQLTLTVAGRGDVAYTERCRQQVHTLGLQDAVRFIGWQTDTASLYRSHQLLLMPTTMREPFGMVIVEAMMHGLTVYAPAAYGPAEILRDGETGRLFRPGDSASLADTLEQDLQQPQRLAEIGQRAQVYAYSHYALDRVKRQVEAVLISAGGQLCRAA